MLTPESIAQKLRNTFPLTDIQPFSRGVKIRLDGVFNGWMCAQPTVHMRNYVAIFQPDDTDRCPEFRGYGDSLGAALDTTFDKMRRDKLAEVTQVLDAWHRFCGTVDRVMKDA
jgi:hypothetical protein